jgi:hypothetical protein
MNYIRHLNAFFSLVKTDNRLTASHVSLYIALFHYWNFNRFNNPFSIYRENIMQLSKLSKNTYHKCLKQLHEAKYIYYHPSPSKFQAVRISIIRLDKEEESPTQYKQLDLFTSINFKTDSVADLSHHSPNIETDTVANLGHSYKPNINKQGETPSHLIFKKNDKIQNAINDLAQVPNVGHDQTIGDLSFRAERGISETPTVIPLQEEVETFFQNKNHPAEEASKFFNHYKALHWKLQGKTPILDWKPLVEKWMQNAKKWEMSSAAGSGTASGRDGGGKAKDIQYLYNSFLEGNKIFKYILPQHFDQLKLELTDETIQNARNERINQISGTNQHSLTELWQAYLTGDNKNELVLKDNPNLIALAKRIAVIKHFHSIKQSGN